MSDGVSYGAISATPLKRTEISQRSIPIVTQLLATSSNRVSLPGGTIYRERC